MAKREQLTVGEIVLPGGQSIIQNPANTAPSAQAVFARRAFMKGDVAISASPAASTAAIWMCVTAGVGASSVWKSLTLSA
jgi:hypothetical protein